MPKLVAIKPLPNFRLWLRYDDSTAGEVDLSDLAGRGVFQAWDDPGAFEKVSIDEHGAIAWGPDLDLCPDSLYLRLTGKSPADVFPGLRAANA